MSQFAGKVKEVLIDLGVEESKIVPEAHLKDDLMIDSLDLTEVIMELETEYNIRISDSAFDKMIVIQDIYNVLEEKVTNDETA